jgi:ABC-type spermidine/putrescine transport system permease subunit II
VRAPSTPTVVAAHALLVVATAAALFPVSWVLKMALSPSQGMAVTANPLPTEVDFGNFAAVVGTHAADGTWLFGRQLVNSLVVSGATATVGVTLACSAAYAMSRWSFPGRDRAMQLFLLTQMFPGVVSAIPLYILLDRLGLLDSLTGLILVYSTTTVPFATWNLKGYFDSIPRELEEAARSTSANSGAGASVVVPPATSIHTRNTRSRAPSPSRSAPGHHASSGQPNPPPTPVSIAATTPVSKPGHTAVSAPPAAGSVSPGAPTTPSVSAAGSVSAPPVGSVSTPDGSGVSVSDRDGGTVSVSAESTRFAALSAPPHAAMSNPSVQRGIEPPRRVLQIYGSHALHLS